MALQICGSAAYAIARCPAPLSETFGARCPCRRSALPAEQLRRHARRVIGGRRLMACSPVSPSPSADALARIGPVYAYEFDDPRCSGAGAVADPALSRPRQPLAGVALPLRDRWRAPQNAGATEAVGPDARLRPGSSATGRRMRSVNCSGPPPARRRPRSRGSSFSAHTSRSPHDFDDSHQCAFGPTCPGKPPTLPRHADPGSPDVRRRVGARVERTRRGGGACPFPRPCSSSPHRGHARTTRVPTVWCAEKDAL